MLTILAANRMYGLLEKGEIGTVINKMWGGKIQDFGIIAASSLYTSYYAGQSNEE